MWNLKVRKMKILKYLTCSLALMLMVVSCDKHEILYDTMPAAEAEFQLHYFEPIKNDAANYIDSVFVNGKLLSSMNGSGTLYPYNAIPSGATGRFFAVNAGETEFVFYRGGKEVYRQTAVLNKGKQNVFVHDLAKAPIVMDNGYPYQHISGTPSVATWNTDSLATIKFVNLLYEDATTPYPGKLQYQWRHPKTKVYHNLGEPVAFGEATERIPVTVLKTKFNSSGYCTIYYKILDEDGNVLKYGEADGTMTNYSDYWTTYIGRAYMHFYAGVRQGGDVGPEASVRVWTSL